MELDRRSDDALTSDEARLAASLRELASDPDPAAARRIMAAVRAAHVAAVPARGAGLKSRWGRRLRLGSVLLVTAAMVVFGAVGAAASNSALPDTPGYGVRLVVERARVQTAGGPEKEHLLAKFARDRVTQARLLISEHHLGAVGDLLKDSKAYLQEAGQHLSDLNSEDRAGAEKDLHDAENDENTTQQDADHEQQQEGSHGAGISGVHPAPAIPDHAGTNDSASARGGDPAEGSGHDLAAEPTESPEPTPSGGLP